MSYKKELKQYVRTLYDIIESEQLIIEDCKLCIEDLDIQRSQLEYNLWDASAYRQKEIIKQRTHVNDRQIKLAKYRIRTEKKTIRQTKKQLRKLKENK